MSNINNRIEKWCKKWILKPEIIWGFVGIVITLLTQEIYMNYNKFTISSQNTQNIISPISIKGDNNKVSLDLSQNKQQEKILGEETTTTFFKENFETMVNIDNWTKEKGIYLTGENELFLGRHATNGYLLTKKEYDEDSKIVVTFVPLTSVINFSIRIKDSFMVIIGDGDDREISLKKFNPDGEWIYEEVTSRKGTERPTRYPLEYPISKGGEVKLIINIAAKETMVNQKNVSLELRYFDQNNNPVTVDNSKIQWLFTVDKIFNGRKRFGVGLVDSFPWYNPKVQLKRFEILN